jgi:hypothetical protein
VADRRHEDAFSIPLASLHLAKPAIPPLGPTLPSRPLFHFSLKRCERCIARDVWWRRDSGQRTVVVAITGRSANTDQGVVAHDAMVHCDVTVETRAGDCLFVGVIGPPHVSPSDVAGARRDRFGGGSWASVLPSRTRFDGRPCEIQRFMDAIGIEEPPFRRRFVIHVGTSAQQVEISVELSRTSS